MTLQHDDIPFMSIQHHFGIMSLLGYHSSTCLSLTKLFTLFTDEDISTFCSDTYKRGRLLYLSNKNYPGPISKGKESCQCLIRTGNEVGLDIHALDIIITRSHVRNQCYQDLQIKDEDGYQKEITCGHAGLYGFRNIYNRDVRTVTLTLNSRAIKKQGYVWLQAKGKCLNTLFYLTVSFSASLILLFSEWPKYHGVLVILRAVELR